MRPRAKRHSRGPGLAHWERQRDPKARPPDQDPISGPKGAPRDQIWGPGLGVWAGQTGTPKTPKPAPKGRFWGFLATIWSGFSKIGQNQTVSGLLFSGFEVLRKPPPRPQTRTPKASPKGVPNGAGYWGPKASPIGTPKGLVWGPQTPKDPSYTDRAWSRPLLNAYSTVFSSVLATLNAYSTVFSSVLAPLNAYSTVFSSVLGLSGGCGGLLEA